MDRNRYFELRYFCKRYNTLSRQEKGIIREAATRVIGKDYARELQKNVCVNVPIKSLNVPFSEREFVRIRKRFFTELDKLLCEERKKEK